MNETALALSPAWRPLIQLVVDALPSSHSRRAYARALDAFLAWCQNNQAAFTRATVQRYRAELEGRHLASSSINVQLSAIRKLAYEAGANGLLAQDLASAIQGVKSVRSRGGPTGNWLTRDEARQLIRLPDPESIRGLRDRVVLGLLIGCGLRRSEAVDLLLTQIQEREGRWVIVNLEGKGGQIRTVPIPAWTHNAIRQWIEKTGLTGGRLLRGVTRADTLTGEGMTPQALFLIVRKYGKRLQYTLAPHDLRRTFAKLAHKGGAPLEQIQLSLGHASIQTTERYLGIQLDLEDAACDRLGID